MLITTKENNDFNVFTNKVISIGGAMGVCPHGDISIL
jgi:hypothetical protein